MLEQGEYTPVGDIKPRRCNVRILAATHQDLPTKIANHAFSTRFVLSIGGVSNPDASLEGTNRGSALFVPGDIGATHYPGAEGAIDEEAMVELGRRAWHGNVRELRNTLEHAALMARGQPIGLQHLPPEQAMVETSGSRMT